MRAMWKGAISFGLVNIPVKLYTATESKEIKFNYIHEECKTPIKYQRVCPNCNREVANEEIVKGYEYEKGRFVILKDEDFEKLPLESIRAIEILDFADMREVDPIYFMKSYFLAPGEFGLKPYRLLFESMQKAGRIAIAKVVLRSKENLAVLRVFKDCLLLETIFFPEEIRSPEYISELKGEVNLHDNELKMAMSLIDSLTSPFEPEKYHSGYREALMGLIHSKIEGKEIEEPQRPEGEKVIDLMEALKASIKAVKGDKKDTKTKAKQAATEAAAKAAEKPKRKRATS